MKDALLVALFGLALAIVSHLAYVHVGLWFSMLITAGCLLGMGLLVGEAHPRCKR